MRRFLPILLAFISILVLFMLGMSPTHAQTGAATSRPMPVKVTAQTSRTVVVSNLETNGIGSFKQALIDATDGDIITFADSLAGDIGPDLSKFPLPNDPIVDKSLTVIGHQSKNIKLKGFTMLMPKKGINFAFRNLVFWGSAVNSNGQTTIENCDFEFYAGVSVSPEASLTIRNSVFRDFDVAIVASPNSKLLVADSLFIGGHTAIAATGATAVVVNSTFVKQEIAIRGESIEVINSTIQANGLAFFTSVSKQAFTVRNTIIALSDTVIKLNQEDKLGHRTLCLTNLVVDGGGNLQYPDTSCNKAISVGDPKFGPLQDNGGPTQTMALLPGNAAVGKGDPAVCASTLVKGMDQRGFVLPAGSSTCDIGAYQSRAVAP